MKLKNLNEIAATARDSFSIYNQEEIELTNDFKLLFTQIIEKNEKQEVSFSKHTTIVHTSKGLTITFPNQWFYIASFFVDYLVSLKEYKNDFNKIFEGVANQKTIVSDIKKSSQIPSQIAAKINTYYDSESDKENFNKFLSDYDWWYGSKTIDRGDYFVSPILNLSRVVNVSQSYIAELTHLLSKNLNLINLLKQSKVSDIIPSQFNEEGEKNELDLVDEDRKLRSIIYKAFSYAKDKFGEEILLEGHEIKDSKIEDRIYKGLTIPKYFNFETFIGLFDKEQSKDDLKSSNTPRFLYDYFKILNYENAYFTSQWNESNGRGLSLGNFNKLLHDISKGKLEIIKEDDIFKLINKSSKNYFNAESFQKACEESGLKYNQDLITRYISSLATKPFVILSGLSGSGKTKLAQSFAQWICEDKNQYCIVPVGADWTNREPLLGYVNALNDKEYIKPENGALTLILEANIKPHKPYFLILDEMNLSHVERYFADFLSIMESKEKFKLHNDAENKKSDIPYELSWPSNLFVVGTVNIDETTYMFSPKVLDRANVIEFRVDRTEIKNFMESAKELTKIDGLGKSMGASFVEIAAAKPLHGNLENLNEELLGFFNDLQKLGAEFGYRTGSEIQTLFSKIDVINPEYADKEDEKIDMAIMQKLLPKLHGSRRKLIKTLELLAQKCLVMDAGKIFNEKGESLIVPDNIKYKLSFEKISRMYKNIIENGFTSYAEA